MSQEEDKIESIGARLHRARLKKRVSVDQVYKDIKVHPRILTALEEDRYDEFLNPVYIKAFLKSYCRYLELDATPLLADYDTIRKKTPKASENARQTAVFSNVKWKEYANLARRWLLPILGGILAVFLSISLVALASKAVRKLKKIGPFRAKTAVVKVEPQEKEPSVIKPLSIPQNQPLTLLVKTKGDVWLEVKADSKTVFKSVLKKGSVEAYKADEQFQLWTGKGEFLDLVLNGNPLGSPGGGVIRKIILTREGLKIEKK